MKLVQCENKHFYDADKFSECPKCASNAGIASPTYTEAIDHVGTETGRKSDEGSSYTPTELLDEEETKSGDGSSSTLKVFHDEEETRSEVGSDYPLTELLDEEGTKSGEGSSNTLTVFHDEEEMRSEVGSDYTLTEVLDEEETRSDVGSNNTLTNIRGEEMICPACGNVAKADECCCWKCGALLREDVGKGKIKKERWAISLPLLISAAALFVFVVVLLTVFILQEQKAKEEKEQLERAAYYAETEDYEHAISTYRDILDLNDKSVEAYLGLADVYILQGEEKKAERILKEGEEITGSTKIREYLDDIEEKKSADNDIPLVIKEETVDKNTEENTGNGTEDSELTDDWRTAYIKIANDALEFDLANYNEEPKFAFVYLDDDGKVIDLAAPFVEHVIEPYTLLMGEKYGGDQEYAYHAPEGFKRNELLWYDCIPGSGKYHIYSEPTGMSGTYYYSHGDIIAMYEPTEEAVIQQYKQRNEDVYELHEETEPQDVWNWNESGHLALYTNIVTLSYQDVLGQLQ